MRKYLATDAETVAKIGLLYRRLKQKAKTESDETATPDWHYGEREMFRRLRLARRLNPLSISNLYKLSSGYGERPGLAGFVFVVLFPVMASLLMWSGGEVVTPSLGHTVGEAVGGSATIHVRDFWLFLMSTVQHATFQTKPVLAPVGLSGAIIATLTRILIPLQGALFALAVRNRFQR